MGSPKGNRNLGDMNKRNQGGKDQGNQGGNQADGFKQDGNAPAPDDHEGATEDKVGDRTGPGAGYDQEPEQEADPEVR